MTKNYKILIFSLIILIVAIGVFAVFRQLSVKNEITGTPVSVNTPPISTTTTPTASGTTSAVTTSTAKISLFKVESSGGKTFLANSDSMTLYVFDHDANGQSSCYGQCATIWPPYLVPAGTSLTGMPPEVGTTMRTGGTSQFTWNGRPLYAYMNDKNPGDTLGNGFSGIWHIISISSSTASAL